MIRQATLASWCALLCSTGLASLSAQEPAPAEPPAAVAEDPKELDRRATAESQPRDPAEIAHLVSELGSDTFARRESAAAELFTLGATAREQLEIAVAEGDFEVRQRCKRLLQQLEEHDYQSRLTAFLNDERGEQKHDLPCWERFRQEVGSDRLARQLFVEMLKEEVALLTAAEKGSKSLGELFQLRQTTYLPHYRVTSGLGNDDVPDAGVAALFFVGSDPKLEMNDAIAQRTSQMVYQGRFQQTLRTGERSEMLKRIIEKWLLRPHTPTVMGHGLLIAMNFDLPQAGLQLARRICNEGQVPAHYKSYSILALGRWGSVQDRTLLESLLDSELACSRFMINKKMTEVQARDVALAVLLHMTQQDPKQYGFDKLQKNPTYVVVLNSIYFEEAVGRDEAIKRYRDWAVKHPIE